MQARLFVHRWRNTAEDSPEAGRVHGTQYDVQFCMFPIPLHDSTLCYQLFVHSMQQGSLHCCSATCHHKAHAATSPVFLSPPPPPPRSPTPARSARGSHWTGYWQAIRSEPTALHNKLPYISYFPPRPCLVLIMKLLCYLRYCKHRSPAGALQYALDRLKTRLGLQTS